MWKNSAKGRPQMHDSISCMTLLLSIVLLPCQAFADTIKIPTKTNADGHVYIEIDIKDSSGNPITVKGIIDSGNGGTPVLNKNLANKLGLTPTGAGNLSGIGGQSVGSQTSSIPAGNAGTPKGGAGPFNVKLQGSVDIDTSATPGLADDEVLLGRDFINQDPAGKGAIVINYEKNTATIYNHAQAQALASLSPFETTLASALAALTTGTGGDGVSIDAFVSSATSMLTAPFTVASGISHTLISASLATALGISPGVPDLLFHAPLGDFVVPSAMLNVALFSSQHPMAIQIGILPDPLNPSGINALGLDLLRNHAAIQINEARGLLSASVPEPCVLSLGVIGMLLLARTRTRNRTR